VVWSFTGSGGRYDPRTDSWRDISTAGAPVVGQNPFFAWTGREMIVWGGLGGSARGEGARYDPALDAWTPMSAYGAPSPRASGAAAWTGCRFLVWGGASADDGTALGDGAEYDPTTDSWTPLPGAGAPSPRSLSTSVWTGSELVVWGGLTGEGTAVGDGARLVVSSRR
jgi:hypothetical protein